MLFKRLLAALGAAALFLTALVTTATPSAAAGAAQLGVFRGGYPDALPDYEAWLGRPVNVGLTFEAYDTWADIEAPDWLLDPWAAWVKADPNRTLVLSIPMIPGRPVSDAENSSMMDQGASGAFDSHFRTLAQRLVAKGLGNTILRIGSEFNGAWTPYRANVNPTAWVQYYRRISQTMTSVAGNSFRVDWNPNHGSGDIAWQDVYPGDDVVDIIGMDYYDQSWSHYENNGLIAGHTREQAWQEAVTAPGGLQDHADFAARHGKPISFPEWGLMARADGHGGGDNPYYVQKMREWIDSHNVAYFSYFEFDAPDGDHELARSDTRFPNASATYRQLFGPDATTGGQTSTPPQDQPSPTPEQPTPATTSAPSGGSAGSTQPPSSETGSPDRGTSRPVDRPQLRPLNVTDTCPSAPSGPFEDTASTVHREAIDCAASLGIVTGTRDGAFTPTGLVSRGQLASMLAHVIEATGGTLPAAPADAFRDDDGTVHELAINQLAAVGVLQGVATERFAPTTPVNRAQMASLLARALEYRLGAPLPGASNDWFVDDDGSMHESDINRIAEARVAAGREVGRFDPGAVTRRDGMASFLVRAVGVLIDHGVAEMGGGTGQ